MKFPYERYPGCPVPEGKQYSRVRVWDQENFMQAIFAKIILSFFSPDQLSHCFTIASLYSN